MNDEPGQDVNASTTVLNWKDELQQIVRFQMTLSSGSYELKVAAPKSHIVT